MSTTFTFNGTPFEAGPGQTVGAALMVGGVSSWRATRKGGRPRGLFCGIGGCFDCLVTVDGAPNERACLVEVREGMRIEGAPAEGGSAGGGSVGGGWADGGSESGSAEGGSESGSAEGGVA